MNHKAEVTDEMQDMVHSIIEAYKQGWNKVNEDKEIDYNITLTYHKVPAPRDSKKTNVDVAYLRLVRRLRDLPSGEWDESLIDQHVHIFKNTKERLQPSSTWLPELYLSLLSKLTYAGLEYAELLRRLKPIQDAEKAKAATIAEPEKDIVITDAMPEELSPDDMKYKEWVRQQKNVT